jgi:anti-anti-sigma regulatory factor
MYKIERRPSGYILTFSGVIDADEMQQWYNDSRRNLMTESSSSFGVIIDMRDLQPLSSEAKGNMISGQKLYKAKGMKKSAVILNSPEVCQQFKNLALQSGIYATERYIDASQTENATGVAINWVKDGIDPDKLE